MKIYWSKASSCTPDERTTFGWMIQLQVGRAVLELWLTRLP